MSGEKKSLQEIIKEEYKKCLLNPVYFMKKYVKIQHPIRGTIPFELYPFQDDTLNDFSKNDFNIVLKSRQMGISTLVAAYSLWLMVFHKDKNVLIISIKQDVSKEIVSKVRFANDNLPSWIKVNCREDNRLSLKLENGSQITATSSATSAGRSQALSLLVLDECAFIEKAEEIWASAQPTLSTGGRAILLSTPNGVGNFFHKMWVQAEEGRNKFKPIKLPWFLHPERDENWRKEQDRVSENLKKTAQELDCDFLSSGTNVIDLVLLDWFKTTYQLDPIEKRGLDHEYWIWQYPDYTQTYIVCLPTGESVLTDSGIKKIENVNYEDKLIDKLGKYTQIKDIKTRLYNGIIYEISPSNTFRTTKFTDEHPILISQSSILKRMYKKDDKEYEFNQRYWKHNFKFVDAKNVKKGDWICFPNRFKINATTTNWNIDSIWEKYKNIGRSDFIIKNPLCDANFWWFVGIWLAKGWCYKDKNENITIYTSHNITEKHIISKLSSIVTKLFNRNLIITECENNTIKCQFNSKQIGTFLNDNFGKYAGGKYISECFKFMPDLYKVNIVKGYINGDGCQISVRNNEKNIKITSISLQLLEDIQDMLFSIGCVSSLNLLRRKSSSSIRNKNIYQKETYSLTIHDYGCKFLIDNYTPKSKTQRISNCYLSPDNSMIYFRIKKVNKLKYNGLVHNFTTEDGTFLCKNITTHNCADVARGDGEDYSAFHVLNATTMEQCAEYKGQLSTKEFGNMLVTVATDYNSALLIVEREGPGWATLQQIIDRGYPNTFYGSADLRYVDVERQISNKHHSEDKKLVPGFATTLRTRPVIISNLCEYFVDRSIQIHSQRTFAELDVFIWENQKAQAAKGYNDDLVMSLAIGIWVRDTALRLRQEGINLTKAALDKIVSTKTNEAPVYRTQHNHAQNSWIMPIGNKTQYGVKGENLKWLL